MVLASRRRLAACALVAASLVVVVPQTAGAVTAVRQRALDAAGYIASQQRPNGAICAFSCPGSTADAVVSLVAARTGGPVVRKALGYLKRQVEAGNITDLGLEAKTVMAAAAGGAGARDFGGVNLVAALKATEGGNGHFGDAAVFDQALVMLALRSVGVEPSAAATAWLRAAQCGDGGWQYDLPAGSGDDEHCFDASAPDPGDFFTSDSNTTSLAIQVLHSGTAVNDGLAFFGTLHDATYGGWGYSQCCTQTDTNSTALVIQAFAAAGAPLPSGGFAALKQLQLGCGAWPYTWDAPGDPGNADIGATIGGVLGILRQPLPVGALAPAFPLPAPVSCA
jgi:hypothetical protein